MPAIELLAAGLLTALAVVMTGTGALNLAGPVIWRARTSRSGVYPAGFHRAAGGPETGAGAGVLLMIPATSRVGAAGSATFMLLAIATLIRSRDCGHLPGAALLMTAAAAAIAIHP